MPAATFDIQLDGERRIGSIGTWSRVVVGLGLLVVGLLGSIHPSGIAWHNLVVGLAALPLLTVLFAVIIGHYWPNPIRLTGPLATGINCLVIVGLASNHITGPTVELFYGATLLAAAWRGQPGCEVTVISNWILRRDDQIGCPLFSPLTAPNDTTDGQTQRRHAKARDDERYTHSLTDCPWSANGVGRERWCPGRLPKAVYPVRLRRNRGRSSAANVPFLSDHWWSPCAH